MSLQSDRSSVKKQKKPRSRPSSVASGRSNLRRGASRRPSELYISSGEAAAAAAVEHAEQQHRSEESSDQGEQAGPTQEEPVEEGDGDYGEESSSGPTQEVEFYPSSAYLFSYRNIIPQTRRGSSDTSSFWNCCSSNKYLPENNNSSQGGGDGGITNSSSRASTIPLTRMANEYGVQTYGANAMRAVTAYNYNTAAVEQPTTQQGLVGLKTASRGHRGKFKTILQIEEQP
ncbi:hypothetical protein DAPPUDRAFT_256596 [Daphnia pulex]|uniref:Uncharacterized protein n=1 Tax=Daphnia pulex TaxID=6669 RepID=E9HBQ7_DAPPU|nr:hypothetical protein DAPPUDRAFT_256596 [Daphnia pulex]|eukprot:EFX70762.1 hypothetical protein DAPPUDRAFT_256596 [Daphnia pulex]